ncbi:MAG: VOC family protein [Rhodobiaceae bacterium]|nr:VOC family protein [Rhodobiaceae bacterium]
MFKRINFQSIPVKDQQRAMDFYRDTLGFAVHTDAPYDGGWRWIFMQIPGAATLLHFARPGEVTVKDVPALCLISDDVDAEAARLREAGVVLVDGPADAPWYPAVRYAMIRDPEDNLILIQSSNMEGN